MKKRNLLPVIGLILFLWIMINIEIKTVAVAIGNADPFLIIMAALLSVPIVLTKSLKWKIIIKSYKTEFPLLKATEAWMIGFFLGIITPGRIGDVSRAYYMKKTTGISTGKSITTVFIDRIIDISILFLLAITGIGLSLTGFSGTREITFYVVMFFMLFLAVIILLTRRKITYFLLKPIASTFIPGKYRSLLSRLFHDFYHGIGEMSKSKMAYALLVDIVSWALSVLQYCLLSLSLGLNIQLMFFFAIIPIVILLDTLPVSISGLGTRDAALIFFFSLIGLSSEMAVSLSLLAFTMIYIPMGITGYFLWLRNPIKYDKKKTL
jgi:uncharacterized protein (TIRG00374 family)